MDPAAPIAATGRGSVPGIKRSSALNLPASMLRNIFNDEEPMVSRACEREDHEACTGEIRFADRSKAPEKCGCFCHKDPAYPDVSGATEGDR